VIYGEIFSETKPGFGQLDCFQFVAQYRLRVGNYRVLYDVDDKQKTVWILALTELIEGKN